MTATQQFIEDAIAGGWKPHLKYDPLVLELEGGQWEFDPHNFFLDPLAWQAVGKTRGWREPQHSCSECGTPDDQSWQDFWHTFIDHLAEGNTPEEAVARLWLALHAK